MAPAHLPVPDPPDPHPARSLPLKYRHKQLHLSDQPSSSSNHDVLHASDLPYPYSEASASSSPVASSIALETSEPNSPTDYAHIHDQTHIRSHSSPRRDYYYSFRNSADPDHDHDHDVFSWSVHNPNLLPKLPQPQPGLRSPPSTSYSYRYSQPPLSPVLPASRLSSSFANSLSYHRLSTGSLSDGHPTFSDVNAPSSDEYDFDADLSEGEPEPYYFSPSHRRRISFSTSCERDRPIDRPPPIVNRISAPLQSASTSPTERKSELPMLSVNGVNVNVNSSASSRSRSASTASSQHSPLPPSSPPLPSSPPSMPLAAAAKDSPLPQSSPLLPPSSSPVRTEAAFDQDEDGLTPSSPVTVCPSTPHRPSSHEAPRSTSLLAILNPAPMSPSEACGSSLGLFFSPSKTPMPSLSTVTAIPRSPSPLPARLCTPPPAPKTLSTPQRTPASQAPLLPPPDDLLSSPLSPTLSIQTPHVCQTARSSLSPLTSSPLTARTTTPPLLPYEDPVSMLSSPLSPVSYLSITVNEDEWEAERDELMGEEENAEDRVDGESQMRVGRTGKVKVKGRGKRKNVVGSESGSEMVGEGNGRRRKRRRNGTGVDEKQSQDLARTKTKKAGRKKKVSPEFVPSDSDVEMEGEQKSSGSAKEVKRSVKRSSRVVYSELESEDEDEDEAPAPVKPVVEKTKGKKRKPSLAGDATEDDDDNNGAHAVKKKRKKARASDAEPPVDATSQKRKRPLPTPTQPPSPSKTAAAATKLTGAQRAERLAGLEARCPAGTSVGEIEGMLVETLATSRASSLAVESVWKAVCGVRPGMEELTVRRVRVRAEEEKGAGSVPMEVGEEEGVREEEKDGEDGMEEVKLTRKEWWGLVQDVLEYGRLSSGVFGRVESSFKDEHAHPLPPHYFYVPESDPDPDRATIIKSMMPRPAKRSETKKYKQYYWKPLGKVSRWDSEDAM